LRYDYLIRRLLIACANLLAAISLVFLMVRLIPGDPVSLLLGDAFNPEAAEKLRAQLGLNLPLWNQYLDFLRRLFSGSLGTSLITHQPVFGEVFANFGFTLQLAFAGLLVGVLLGVPAGVVAALRRGKLADLVAMSGATVGISMPSFWLGILLMIVFAVELKWLPMFGVGQPGQPLNMVTHLILPAFTLGLRGAALTARVTRSSMLEVLALDYIRTARGKGLSELAVTGRHALRNSMLPVVTVVGMDLARMLGGTTVIETVFSRPGIGTLLVGSVLNRDYPMVQGAFLVYLSVIVLSNLLVDLLYARLDPRVAFK
jgi:peptide/nickel transport system permease protein